MVRGPHGHLKQVNWITGEADLTLGPFSKVGFEGKFGFRIREHFLVISNLTEEIQVSRRASDRGSYAKPLFVRALSSHSRV